MNRFFSRRALVIARLALGVIFLYVGIGKAFDPVGFLKSVRAYDLVHAPVALNLIAAVLPWFEAFCGALLIAGVKVRAAALWQLLLLVGFTTAIVLRAAAVHRATGQPLLAVQFDCGCGTGEVVVGMKLLENIAFIALAAVVAFSSPRPPPAAEERR
jgi:putative oxidoreductase